MQTIVEDHTTIIEKIRNIHTELKLCGKPGNALLNVSEELLLYVLSLLRGEVPVLPEASLDEWNGLLSTLRPHWIIPLLYWKISRIPSELHPPKEIHNQLMQDFMWSRARCFQMERQLREIINTLNNEGVRALVLKGPSLAGPLYPDAAARPFEDLDLLVLPEQFIKTRTVLSKLGYQCIGKRFEISRDFYCEEILIPPRDKRGYRQVELHWDLYSFSGINLYLLRNIILATYIPLLWNTSPVLLADFTKVLIHKDIQDF